MSKQHQSLRQVLSLMFGVKPRVIALFCLATLLLTAAGPTRALAADMEVDVQLVLAVDVSRSMAPTELEIQRRGYAEALTSDEVISAIRKGLLGHVAITYIEWAGNYSQRTIVDWTLISNADEAHAFAEKLTADFNTAMRRTSISGALEFAANLFDDNGFKSHRRIIDVSGDGPNNQGRPVLAARQETLNRGIVINGLPLMTREGMGTQFGLDDLDEYYRHCVIGGPRAFVVPVLSWDQFPAAVRQKLILELAQPDDSPVMKASYSTVSEHGYDCMIGEKIWERIRQQWELP